MKKYVGHSPLSDELITERGPDAGRRSVEGRANIQEVKNTCIILNTAEYCKNTSLQLEERVRDKIKQELRGDITFQPARDSFTGCVIVSTTGHW